MPLMGSVPVRQHDAAAQARIFRALHEVALASSGVLDPVELARLTIDQARDLLGGQSASLYWWNATEKVLGRMVTNSTGPGREVLAVGKPGLGAAGRAFFEGKAVVVSDYASYEDAVPELLKAGIGSAIAIPLLIRDKPVGVLVVGAAASRQWEEQDVELLVLLGAQITPAIVAARLAQERDHQATRFHVLHELSVAAGSLIDLNALATLTVDRTRDLVGGWSASLVWYGEGGARILADNHPFELPLQDLAPGRGMTARVLATNEMVVVEDYPNWEHAFDWAIEAGVRSMIGVPLKVQDRSVGCLLVRSREPGYFKADHRELLPLLAAQVGPAIHSAWLSAERERQAALFRNMHDLAVAASGVLEPAQLARVAVERCRDLLAVDGTVIYVHNPRSGFLEPLHQTASALLENVIRPGEGAIGLSFARRQTFAIDDYSEWEHRMAGPDRRGLASGLSFPLIGGDQVIGVLGVWKKEPHHWTDREVQVVSLVAAQVGPALETARVAKERERQAETLRSLHEVAIAANGILEPDELAELAVHKACELLGATSAEVNWWDEEIGGLRSLHDNMEGAVPGPYGDLGIGANGKAFSTRQPVLIPDYPSWPQANAGAVKAGTKSVAVVPLLSQDRAVGALAVRYSAPREFGPDDLQILTLLAATLAPTIEAARLHAKLSTSERRLRLIFDTASLVIARCDLHGVPLEINPAVEEVFGFTQAEAVGKRRREFVVVGGSDDGGRFEQFVKGEIDRYQVEQQYRTKSGGTFWGHTILSLVRDAEGRPDYFYAIIEDVSERRRAAEAAQAQTDIFRALHEVATAAAGVLEPAQLAKIAAERARDLLGSTGGSICWYDEGRDGLRVLAQTGIDFDPDLVIPVASSGAQGYAFEVGEPVVIDDYHAWPRRVEAEMARVRSALVVPLRVRQRLIGTLGVHFDRSHEFSPENIQLLTLLAAEVAPSLEAARLHEGLVASTRSIRAIFDTAPVGIARLDPRLNILGLNRRAEELTGNVESDLVGRPVVLSLIGAEDLLAPVEELLAGKRQQLSFERSIRRRSGGSFLAELTLTAVRNPAGEAEFLYAMFDDITERKRAEEALRESEGRKSAIVQSALDCIVAADDHGRIIEFNPAAEKTFGRRRQDVLGRGLWETIIPAPMRQRQDFALDDLIGAETRSTGRRFETVAVRADGVQFPIELSVAAFQQDGKTMFSASIRDLSEREQAETMRQESEAKSRFVAAMSHELRTPLNSILGFSQLLSGSGTGDLNDRQQRYIGHIESSGRHLLALINDVLDLSKVEAGQMEVELEPIELAPLIEEAINQLRPLADAKPLDLLLDAFPQIWIRADRRRFLQVMLNLLSNAIKFTPAGGVVRVMATRAGRSAEIAVVDTGVGIPATEQDRIFLEFTQVDRQSSETIEGTGLGLALSRRLLQLMRGSIRVESAEGSGSTFTVSIPRVRPGEVADARPLLLIVNGPKEDPTLITRLEAGPYRVMATDTVREAAMLARRRRLAGIILGESLAEGDEGWLREALRDHPRTHSLPILSAAVALHPGVLIRD